MSAPLTAETSVSVTVASAIATPPPATSRRAPPTVTWNAPGAGTEPVSRASSNVSASVFLLTVALSNAGAVVSGVSFVTASPANVSTSLPAKSARVLPEAGFV